jgi:outer membrane lipoprotein-sorting protein
MHMKITRNHQNLGLISSDSNRARFLTAGILETGWRFFYVTVRQQTSCLLFLVAVVSCASAQTESTVPTVETIIARMAQARADNRARFRSYVVTRDYKLFGKEREKTESQVTADVIFDPPDFKKYAIQQTSGAGLGEKIVRRMLDSEVEVTKDYSSTDISPDNYDFRFIREEDVSGHRSYVLELLPRRRDKNLLRGNIWVDANTFLLHRTEGEPAKRTSWWLRDVRIALLYGDVSGMWLQTASESTAKVRILGQYTMVSRDVKYKISELVADGSSRRAPSR